MNSLEVANYISKMCEKNLPSAIKFIENELAITIGFEKIPTNFFPEYRITYNKLNEVFHSDEAKKFVLALWSCLDEPQRQKLIDVCKTTRKKTTSKQVKSDVNISPTFNVSANANASNENIITISTLSQLSNQVSQSTTIENKMEIQELISQLEDAKDEGNEESYFDLFFKLLDKLSGSGLIPEWLVKSAKFAQKFINK